MDWGMVGAMTGVATLGFSVLGWLVNSKANEVKAAAELRTTQLEKQIGEWRAADKKEIREYMNGSFMRAAEAHQRFNSIEGWVRSVDGRLASLDQIVRELD